VSVVDSRYGSLRVIDTDFIISRSLTLYGEWAQGEIDLLSLFISSGDVVIDAGSFIGTHALAFAAIVGTSGRVLAFEPRKSFRRFSAKTFIEQIPTMLSWKNVV